jgi:hypothetical protein
VATIWPLMAWSENQVDPSDVFEEFSDRWSLQGVRPLNHPRLRLRQYAAWCAARPDWPSRLRDDEGLHGLASGLDTGDEGAGVWRRRVRLTAQRSRIQDRLCASAVSGSRLDNLVCDGFLPLLAAQTGLDLQRPWAGWYAGDAPEALAGVLQALGIFGGASRPVAHGPIQGLLGWMLAREEASAEA